MLTGDGLRDDGEATTDVYDDLFGLSADSVVLRLTDIIEEVRAGRSVESVGLAFPGVVRAGVILESPNFPQMKGCRLGDSVELELAGRGCHARVSVFNDADVVAAGIAASRDMLDSLVRVWTLGNGIGFGRYPAGDSIWEGGHTVVTLDPKERYCGCGGIGHLEGIMGYRAMRLRFLDLEPDEVFEGANEGEERCVAFVRLWHRALAAATASSVHMDGPGKFYLTGPGSAFLNLSLLHRYMHEMVKMSPLLGCTFEVVPSGHEIAIIGAAVNSTQNVSQMARAGS
ncbi:MAG: ROK family protein [Bryobacteraceae bacterium]